MKMPRGIDIPPFHPGPAGDVRADHCSAGGAKLLAERIERMWALRGYPIIVSVEPVGRFAENGASIMTWQIRSNMVNGVPPVAGMRA